MANIHDVAKLAGVSVATVSRVLNNHPYVKADKAAAVREAIKKTGYTQNINAIHLKRGKTCLIGIVIPFLDHPYFSQLANGIAKAVSNTDFKIVIFQTNYNQDKEIDALNMLKSKQIDSLIFCSRRVSLNIIKEYNSSGKIVLFEDVDIEGISCSYVNHYDCFKDALEFLFESNHTRIGICISRRKGTSSIQREKAFRDFYKSKNLDLLERDIYTGCLYLEDGAKLAQRLYKSGDCPSALLVTNDQVAAGLLTTFNDLGWSVPEDVAIIGFDNQQISKALHLTTIDIPLYSIGQLLVEQALLSETTKHEIDLEIVKRKTV
ncbi:transcriptional regulator, LacI family [Marininema mesophilum]|uniref:Transcriptional regulator, LacI family n=1 Tax=Marininema mesophilum TaxID=1048340 RepID=A0A1H2VGB3_9BACL|nr:LacI family DNA-binding transcriptional regulator [Marininema mesophilum]SDW66899.1 transcriptional regulator, LacI family [Marininema mesophilum]